MRAAGTGAAFDRSVEMRGPDTWARMRLRSKSLMKWGPSSRRRTSWRRLPRRRQSSSNAWNDIPSAMSSVVSVILLSLPPLPRERSSRSAAPEPGSVVDSSDRWRGGRRWWVVPERKTAGRPSGNAERGECERESQKLQ